MGFRPFTNETGEKETYCKFITSGWTTKKLFRSMFLEGFIKFVVKVLFWVEVAAIARIGVNRGGDSTG